MGREEGKIALQHHGVPGDLVHVTGIPCRRAFYTETLSKKECAQTLGLQGRNDKPVILICSSGGNVVDIYKSALAVTAPIEIVVITGRQADVRAELAKVDVPERHSVKLEGFTDLMHQYMRAADIIITKPGGLTTAESLAMGLAMVIVNPYPGQEVRNADMLLEAGAGIKVNDAYMLTYKLDKLVRDRDQLQKMQRASMTIGTPYAAVEICSKILEIAGPISSPVQE